MEPAHIIDATERLSHLQNQMAEHNVSRFVVTDNGKIAGIVTETDLAVSLRKFREKIEDRHQDFRFHNLFVRAVMTTPIVTVGKDTGTAEVVDLMLEKNISSIPVTDKGRVVGLVTRRSLVGSL
jgi:CBS domain-containing protein